MPVLPTVADRPTVVFGGRSIEVPFAMKSGEFAELEDGWWIHYSDQSQPLARVKGPVLELAAGDNRIEWRSPTRAEMIVTALGAETEALKRDAAMPEYMFSLPLRYAPSSGFDAPARLAVAAGERRQVRLEILGEVDRPRITVGDATVEFPVAMRKGDRLLCRDGKEWLLRDAKRKTLATGTLERPLPVIASGADVGLSCANPAAAEARVLVSSRRISD